jgi:superfamily II DNA or RNA helicase
MSVQVELDSVPFETREKIAQDLSITVDKEKKFSKFQAPPKKVDVYEIFNNVLVLPFAYAIISVGLPKPPSTDFAKIDESVVFVGSLRDEQKSIKDEAISNLNKYGACLISAYPGFGKTCTSIFITSKIKLKTLIILNRLVLMDQWESAIAKFCPKARVSRENNNSTDYIIMNAINIPKMPRDFYNDIGVVIVDEAHLIMSAVLSKSMFSIHPKYVIGLSATPYRNDGYDSLINLFFTEHKIVRTLQRKHTVFLINTGFKPEVEYDVNGKVLWSSIIDQQSTNPTRNELIINIITRHHERIFLVLCKRVEQTKLIYEALVQRGIHSTILVGSATKFDKEARVLVATTGKAGVGFDFDRLDAMILAADHEAYYIQTLGRIFRREDTEPIVFDLVDDNPILKRHFSTRKAVYAETGGEIKKYIV